MTPSATVYLVTNLVNGSIYVGVTRFSVEKRWREHIGKSKRHPLSWLHRSIAKYGPDNFTIVPLASCLSVDAAQAAERAVIQVLAPVYNQTNGGEMTVGRCFTPEVRAKLSMAQTGRTHSAERIAANSAQATARYANDPAFTANMAVHLSRVRCLIDETKRRAAVGASASERVWTADSRAKLSASCMGRKYGRDVLDRIAEKHRKAVHCIELNRMFPSVSAAAKEVGLSVSGVSRVARGERASANALTFRFVRRA